MSDNRKILIVRHGQTDWNINGHLNSRTDVELNKDGLSQAFKLAKKLQDVEVHRIVTSPLKRAMQTAKIVADSKGITSISDNRLVELDFGIFEGKSPSEAENSDIADAFRAWRDERKPIFADDCECFTEASKRVESVFKEISKEGGTTLIVSHGVISRILIAVCVLNMSPSYYRRLRLDNGKIAQITFEGHLPRLIGLNQ